MKLSKEFLEELSKLKPFDPTVEEKLVKKLIMRCKKHPGVREKLNAQFKLK